MIEPNGITIVAFFMIWTILSKEISVKTCLFFLVMLIIVLAIIDKFKRR